MRHTNWFLAYKYDTLCLCGALKKRLSLSQCLYIRQAFFYAQEFECECKGGTAYKISAELTQITGELRLRINEADVVLYVNGARIGSPFLCFSLVPAAKKNYDGSYTYFEQNSIRGCKWILKISEGEHIIKVKKIRQKDGRNKGIRIRKNAR